MAFSRIIYIHIQKMHLVATHEVKKRRFIMDLDKAKKAKKKLEELEVISSTHSRLHDMIKKDSKLRKNSIHFLYYDFQKRIFNGTQCNKLSPESLEKIRKTISQCESEIMTTLLVLIHNLKKEIKEL